MANTMTMEAFMSAMKEKGFDGSSQYSLRNESIQKKGGSLIFNLKKEAKKKAKLLFFTELAIPFNPLTGMCDETYNPDNKFRPTTTATTTALMLKKSMNEESNAEVKKIYMEKAGVDEWDTSDTEHFTDQDWKVFKRYRVPRIFTFPVIHIDIPSMTGQYGQDFLVNVPEEGYNSASVDAPLWYSASSFFKALSYEEVNDFKAKVEKGEIRQNKDQQALSIQAIFQQNPITDDHPKNIAMLLELPVKNDLSLEEPLSVYDESALRKCTKMVTINKAIREALEKFCSGEFAKSDNFFDFFELDMSCPSEVSRPSDLGSTTYSRAVDSVGADDNIEKFKENVRGYIDGIEDMEKLIIRSARIPNYTENTENSLAGALESVVDLESKYLTKEIIKKHKRFICIAKGDEADDLLLDVETGISDKAEGTYNEAEANKAAKEAALNAELETVDIQDILNSEVQ